MYATVLAGRGGSSPSQSRSRRARRGAALLVTFVAVVAGPGTAYASAIDVLPGSTAWAVPDSISGLAAELPTGVTVTGVAETVVGGTAVAGAAVVAVPAEVVAGVVLGTAAALSVAWKLGGAVGVALPCLSCPATTGNPTSQTFANGWSLTNMVTTATRAQVTISNPGQGLSGAQATGYTPGVGGNSFYNTAGTASSPLTVTSDGSGYTGWRFIGVAINNASITVCFNYPGCVSSNKAGDGSLLSTSPTTSTGGGSSTAPNPATALAARGTSQCRDPAGTMSTVTAFGAKFYQSADYTVSTTSGGMTSTTVADSFGQAIPAPACAPGSTRTGFGADVVPLQADGTVDTSGTPVPLLRPVTIPGTAPAGHPEYAPCMPGGAAYPCKLVLSKTESSGQVRPYDPAVDFPINDPTADPTGRLVATPPWSCVWGPIPVPVQECSPVFLQPLKAVTNTGGNGCFAGMGLSPLTWPQGLIISPLKCLFIPNLATLQADWASVASAYNGTVLGSLTSAVGGMIAPVTGLANSPKGDCDGPAITLPIPFYASTMTFHPLSACASEVQSALGIWIPVASAGIYFAAVMGAYRKVGVGLLNTDPTPGA